MLFDTHAHYDDEAFDADRDAVLTALPQRGVGLILNPGCDVESSRRAVTYAAAYPHVYAAVGIHPENCGGCTADDLAAIRALRSLLPRICRRASYSIPGIKIVQEAGLEPARYCYHRHLKPARLPIPPFLHNFYYEVPLHLNNIMYYT